MKYLTVIILCMFTYTGLSQDIVYNTLVKSYTEESQEVVISLESDEEGLNIFIKSESELDLKLRAVKLINEEDDLPNENYVVVLDSLNREYVLFFGVDNYYCSLTTVGTNETIEFYNQDSL